MGDHNSFGRVGAKRNLSLVAVEDNSELLEGIKSKKVKLSNSQPSCEIMVEEASTKWPQSDP